MGYFKNKKIPFFGWIGKYYFVTLRNITFMNKITNLKMCVGVFFISKDMSLMLKSHDDSKIQISCELTY